MPQMPLPKSYVKRIEAIEAIQWDGTEGGQSAVRSFVETKSPGATVTYYALGMRLDGVTATAVLYVQIPGMNWPLQVMTSAWLTLKEDHWEVLTAETFQVEYRAKLWQP